jgi:uncharacterized repeat protein (TIGR03943 family)
MFTRLQNTVKGLVLIGLALFLTHRILDGTLLFYINRRFAWLTWVATLILLFMAYANQRARAAHPPHHPHDHHAGALNTWSALALVALPLLLGLIVSPRPLGAQAAAGRETLFSRAAAERNILDWLRAFYADDDPAAFVGQTARVVGFVFRDDAYAADRFMVSRYVVSCCAADATVVGMVVAWPGSAALPLNAWVEVQGTLTLDPAGDDSTLIIAAQAITPTIMPDQPYLYP